LWNGYHAAPGVAVLRPYEERATDRRVVSIEPSTFAAHGMPCPYEENAMAPGLINSSAARAVTLVVRGHPPCNLQITAGIFREKRMTRSICCIVCICALVALTGLRVHAQNQPSPAEAKALAAQYVAAANAKDIPRLLTLYHPKSAACITPDTKDYYDWALGVSMRDSIPADYRFTVMAVNEGNRKGIESMARFPVNPTSEMHIDYQQGNDVGSVVLWLAQENGRWFADQPCVTEQSLKIFRDGAAARKEAQARYKSLADGIKDPLRSELMGMLGKHDTAAAIDRYRQASGQNTTTSMLVINELKAELK
jgi:hypothetical protein